MGETREQCQSYRDGSLICMDGFRQVSFCRGYAGCVSCGQISERSLPQCLTDEFARHLMDDAGRMRLRSTSLPAGGANG